MSLSFTAAIFLTAPHSNYVLHQLVLWGRDFLISKNPTIITWRWHAPETGWTSLQLQSNQQLAAGLQYLFCMGCFRSWKVLNSKSLWSKRWNLDSSNFCCFNWAETDSLSDIFGDVRQRERSVLSLFQPHCRLWSCEQVEWWQVRVNVRFSVF